MHYSKWLPVGLAALIAGCGGAPKGTDNTVVVTPPAPPAANAPVAQVTPAPAEPTASAPAAAPHVQDGDKPAVPTPPPAAVVAAVEPIVGKWEVSTKELSMAMAFAPDGKVSFDIPRTRAGLEKVVKEQAQARFKGDPKAMEMVMKDLDKQMEMLGTLQSTWERKGELYKLTSKTPDQPKAAISWVKVKDDALIPVDEKGVPKKTEPSARRIKE